MTEIPITYVYHRPSNNISARVAMRQAARLAERIAVFIAERDEWIALNEALAVESRECVALLGKYSSYVYDLQVENAELDAALASALRAKDTAETAALLWRGRAQMCQDIKRGTP